MSDNRANDDERDTARLEDLFEEPARTATEPLAAAQPLAATELLAPSTGFARIDDPRPRVRWGAIAWGFIAIAITGLVLSVVASPGSRDGFVDWVLGLGVGGAIVVGVVVLGAFILLQGVLALARRGHRA